MSDELSYMIAEFGSTVDVWRSPAASGGKVGAFTQAGTAIPGLLVPASERASYGGAPHGLAGARVDYWLITLPGAMVINPGDEVRRGTVKYKVESAGDWTLGKAHGLSLPK